MGAKIKCENVKVGVDDGDKNVKLNLKIFNTKL